MAYKISILKPAEIELDEAFNWYNEQRLGLGNRFVREVSEHLHLISNNPYLYSKKYDDDYRFAPLKVFPYVIAYWIEPSTIEVFVASIFHTSRDPKRFET